MISLLEPFLLIDLSIIIVMLILFYYSIKNASLLGGTFMNFLRTLGTSVILIGVTTDLLVSYYQLPGRETQEFIILTLITGVLLLACEQIYYGFIISGKFERFSLMEMLISFKFERYRIVGLLIILFITIPASIGFLRADIRFINLVGFSILVGISLLAMSERKLNNTLNFVKSGVKADRKHLSILRDDLLTLNICTDITNSYINVLSEFTGKKPLLSSLQYLLNKGYFISDLLEIDLNDKISITAGVNELEPSKIEENKGKIVADFTEMIKGLMGVYGKVFSQKAARESFIEIFYYTKERYGNPLIFRSIINELSDVVDDGDTTTKYDEKFLENMIHKRAVEMAQSFNKIKEVTEERTAIIESMADPLLVIDEQDIVTSVNKAYEKVFGFSKDELEGKKLAGNIWYDSFAEPCKNELNDIVHEARMKGKAGPVELEVKNSKGKDIYVTLVASKVSLLRRKKNVLLVFRDVSKMKKREKELKILDHALESSINGVCIADMEGDILYVNSSFMNLFRYGDQQHILNESISSIVPKKESKLNIIEILRDLGGWMGEKEFMRNDGSVFECLTMGALVKDDTGEPIAYMLSMVDITDKKSSEEWKEFMHSLLVHDVGNKLQIARGYLELILDMDMDEEKKDMAGKGLEAINSGGKLIDKVRLLREVESDIGQGRINPYFILDDVLSTYEDRIEAKGIELITDIKKTNVKVRSGSQGGTLIESVFSNLIDNAIKHASCSRIKISSKVEDDFVIISIEDDGKGLPKKIIEELASDKLISKKRDSSNLGLVLATGLTRKLEGRIRIYHSDMGGAGFDVYLKKNSA